jgi:hypothetical protein
VCVTIADFSAGPSDAANAQWAVVNDNVMGGRSLGDRTFSDQSMVFSGSINTNGGGFSSLRFPLAPSVLDGATHVRFTARADDRSYLLTFSDALDGRDQRISFRAPLEFTSPGEWETATVELDSLYAAVFGQRVLTEPFRADRANRIGIMLSDGIDGEFRLEVGRVEACARPD